MVDFPLPESPTRATVFPPGNVQGHVLQGRLSPLVAEGNVLQADSVKGPVLAG